MAPDGDPCCWHHYCLGLRGLNLEALRMARLPRRMQPGEEHGWNARIDAALGATQHRMMLSDLGAEWD